MRQDLPLILFVFNMMFLETLPTEVIMQTEAINTTTDTEVSQEQEVTQSKSFNFSLDGNIGIQMAFMTGLGGILYYLFSCTCPV